MSKVKYIKGKCESGIESCRMPSKRRTATYNLYHTVDGVKTWKNVCDLCVLIIEKENEGLWPEAMNKYRKIYAEGRKGNDNKEGAGGVSKALW